MGDGSDLIWPEADFSRVPFEVFTDPDLHGIEQKKIFQGPVWNFLCLDVEIPNPGDFKVVYVGDTAVVVNRGEDGEIYSFVNRCAHRGAMVVRDPFGTTTEHTCVYHRWVYDNEGNLKFVPFLRGIKGKGGMPKDFRREDHGLQKLKVARYLNVVYGSFNPNVEPFEEYLGPRALEFLDRLFEREPEVMGYMRNRFSSNWKCFWENFNDGWHAGLLHQLPVIFGLHRLTQECNLYLDKWGRHAVHYLTQESDTAEEVSDEYKATGLYDEHLKFNDPTILDERREFVNDKKAAQHRHHVDLPKRALPPTAKHHHGAPVPAQACGRLRALLDLYRLQGRRCRAARHAPATDRLVRPGRLHLDGGHRGRLARATRHP